MLLDATYNRLMSLEIYVEAGCSTSDRARELASEMTRLYPKLGVDVVDISDTDREVPEAVFAVPTYILDGAVISLGNPSYEELASWLNGSSSLDAPDASHTAEVPSGIIDPES